MRILRLVPLGLLIAVVAAGAAVAVARTFYLPASACEVAFERLAALQLEKMTYRDVATNLGCDGVQVKKQDYGETLVIEDYSWRLAAWPYGRFDGQFINGVLHGTGHRLVKLSWQWTEP